MPTDFDGAPLPREISQYLLDELAQYSKGICGCKWNVSGNKAATYIQHLFERGVIEYSNFHDLFTFKCIQLISTAEVFLVIQQTGLHLSIARSTDLSANQVTSKRSHPDLTTSMFSLSCLSTHYSKAQFRLDLFL